MTENYIIFEPLKIDFNIYFLGTEAEQAAADRKQEERAEQIKRVIFAPSFIAAEYYTPNGSRRILHHSTRAGVTFQLSYIDAAGVAVMHENYITDGTANPYKVGTIESAAALLDHFIIESNESPLTLHILTA